jgi:hypothetical protein
MSALNSKTASFFSKLSVAAQKKPDFIVGWEAGRSEPVRQRIEQYNSEVTQAYAIKLLGELDDQLKI